MYKSKKNLHCILTQNAQTQLSSAQSISIMTVGNCRLIPGKAQITPSLHWKRLKNKKYSDFTEGVKSVFKKTSTAQLHKA